MQSERFPEPTFQDPELVRKGAYINGEWIESAPEFFEVTNPASGDVIAKLPEQPVSEVERAIDVAFDAFKTYKNTSPRDRAKWLRNMYNLMIENVEDLAKIIAWENGKAMCDAIGEIKYAASYFEWYAEEAPRLYGATIQPSNPTNRVMTLRQPVGVCGIICPWNFPSAMITRKAAAALAAGCTVVIKPDSATPLSALALGYLAEKAGIPNGVLNIVLSHTRTPEFGLRLCESPKVKKITFTGSTNVGKILMKQSASTLKKLSLELGGNAPLIIFDDADLDQAVEQAIASKFRGLGQTCVCCNRLYVHSSIIDEFADRLAAEVRKFSIGYGLDPKNTHGCLINEKAVAKVEHHKKDAIEKGAKIVVEGGLLPDLGSNFYAPVVLSHVPHDALVAKEETFGPLCPIFAFDTLEEVVELANDSEFGLASYVFSKNIDTVYTVAEALESGIVSANTGLFSDCSIPFGGVKESGFGREGSLYGIEDYTVIKTINIGCLPPRI
ncbi:similar to Saccharomyces cerevisiae YBR006W UGA2 Succinate semialdehyde dehydrogenase involved in the utilization of gamma-aminobutyrate (GABA) as a nitrogen source [Maudiozyma saulgeensis]|uniref:Succinate-semialdehyde dehydrogenase n=1 Tax=Maudiozyma saulgeensis TaxID=1789683 RepID=A0A1X7R700_9SACH|nr:similar to Saccharomyces cerevisiae YBR006W UGA2 Succinate semialdehyde dehydrogenase involved in the utilization of gamma-aminobutyrate (GABA) as a nitrogen source [Kazachstania saulgeensis]